MKFNVLNFLFGFALMIGTISMLQSVYNARERQTQILLLIQKNTEEIDKIMDLLDSVQNHIDEMEKK